MLAVLNARTVIRLATRRDIAGKRRVRPMAKIRTPGANISKETVEKLVILKTDACERSQMLLLRKDMLITRAHLRLHLTILTLWPMELLALRHMHLLYPLDPLFTAFP